MHKLKPHLIKQLLPLAAGPDDSRKYLQCVYIEPEPTGGVYYVATNGHVLGAIYDHDSSVEGQIMFQPGKDLISVIKKSADDADWLLCKNSHDTAHTDPETPAFYGTAALETRRFVKNRAGLVGTYTLLQGQYPKWQNVLPKKLHGLPPQIGVNPTYLGLFKLMFTKRTWAGVLLRSNVEPEKFVDCGEIVLTNPSMPERIGVVMTMRIDGSDVCELPASLPCLHRKDDTEVAKAA